MQNLSFFQGSIMGTRKVLQCKQT